MRASPQFWSALLALTVGACHGEPEEEALMTPTIPIGEVVAPPQSLPPCTTLPTGPRGALEEVPGAVMFNLSPKSASGLHTGVDEDNVFTVDFTAMTGPGCQPIDVLRFGLNFKTDAMVLGNGGAVTAYHDLVSPTSRISAAALRPNWQHTNWLGDVTGLLRLETGVPPLPVHFAVNTLGSRGTLTPSLTSIVYRVVGRERIYEQPIGLPRDGNTLTYR